MKALLDELGNLSAIYGRTELERACKKFFSGYGAVRQKRKRIPRAWVLEALDRQGGVCKRCGNPLQVQEATGDHTIPVSENGKHNKWNITAMHGACNSAKGARLPMAESKSSNRTILEIIKR